MKLPNGDNAHISPEKIRNYLLSELHPIGKLKAKFFRAVGYNESGALAISLLAHARLDDVKEVISSAYGTKYVLDGMIETPSKRLVRIQSVWIIEKGDTRPKFVTAYPV